MQNQVDKRKQEVDEIFKKLEQGVKEVFTSENYKNYLSIMSTFHRYSVNNQLLIRLQKPDAKLVAGYEAWKAKKRWVNKGEKGIRILAPQRYYVYVDKNTPVVDENGKIKKDENGKTITESKKVKESRIRFVPVSVFDVSQTSGEPLPTPTKVRELDGNVPEKESIMAALKRVADIPVVFEPINNGAKGYYHPGEQYIAIKEGMSDLQTIKTAIHEVAHKLLHDPEKLNALDQANLSRNEKEVQAESVAYIVSDRLGLDTSDYSFGYIAHWSKGKELKELKESLQEIQGAAEKIINEVEKELELYKGAQERESEVAAKVDNDLDKKIEEMNLPTVTVLWSEHKAFKENETYSLAEFDEKIIPLDNKAHYENFGYYKTKIEINVDIDGQKEGYVFRYDIGDRHGGIIPFVKSTAIEELKYATNETDKTTIKQFINDVVPYLESSMKIQKEHADLQAMRKHADKAKESLTQTKKEETKEKTKAGISNRAKAAVKKSESQRKTKETKEKTNVKQKAQEQSR